MSLKGTYNLTVTALGINVVGNAEREATTGIDPVDDVLPVGVAGTMTGWTDVNTCEVTIAGTTLTVANVVDLHWDGGSRGGMTVTGVAYDVVSLDGGYGDDIPAPDSGATVAVVVTVPQTYDVTFDGDNLVLIGVGTSRQSRVTFFDSSNAVLETVYLAANSAWGWASDLGGTNPLAGNAVSYIKASNGNATYTSTIKITGLQYAV